MIVIEKTDLFGYIQYVNVFVYIVFYCICSLGLFYHF